MAGLFTAENCMVEIYLDDGSGAPLGNVLLTLRFKQAVALAASIGSELIPHAGYPVDEIALTTRRHTLDLQKYIESKDTDLRLTDALYYIRVTEHTDDYSAYDRYNLHKCRRLSWNLQLGDSGAMDSRASFAFEDYDSESI